jgi:predicted alpha/beta-fold hydrolase
MGIIKAIKQKQKQFPNLITRSQIRTIFTLNDFDEVYTSRAHGFKNAQDYYAKASSPSVSKIHKRSPFLF